MKAKFKIEFALRDDGSKVVRVYEHSGGFFGCWRLLESFFPQHCGGPEKAVAQAMDWVKTKICNELGNASWARRAPIYLDVEGNKLVKD